VITRNGEHAGRAGFKGGFSLDAIELSGHIFKAAQAAEGFRQGVEMSLGRIQAGRIDRDDGFTLAGESGKEKG
jgi:hypothetical protein